MNHPHSLVLPTIAALLSFVSGAVLAAVPVPSCSCATAHCTLTVKDTKYGATGKKVALAVKTPLFQVNAPATALTLVFDLAKTPPRFQWDLAQPPFAFDDDEDAPVVTRVCVAQDLPSYDNGTCSTTSGPGRVLAVDFTANPDDTIRYTLNVMNVVKKQLRTIDPGIVTRSGKNLSLKPKSKAPAKSGKPGTTPTRVDCK